MNLAISDCVGRTPVHIDGRSLRRAAIRGGAQRAFHTASAAITVIDDERFWIKANAGAPVTEGLRSSAICVTTIGQAGALCVFDPEPREVGTFDRALLRDIALMVQKELWLGFAAQPATAIG